MMPIIFGCMLIGIILGWYKKDKLSFLSIFMALVCVTSLFLFEIYSKQYGFEMPWISI